MLATTLLGGSVTASGLPAFTAVKLCVGNLLSFAAHQRASLPLDMIHLSRRHATVISGSAMVQKQGTLSEVN